MTSSATPESVAIGLRRWTRGHDPHVRAAVELLIEHGWLRYKPFRCYVKRDSDGQCWVVWRELRAAFDADEFICYGGSHSQAVLDFAIDLGSNKHLLATMGSASSRDMVKALADALCVKVTFG